jgi:hypothetical protein
MPESQDLWTFHIASTTNSAVLAQEVKRVMCAAGHEAVDIRGDPRITIIIGLGQTIQISPGYERDSMEWLREMVHDLEFGGSAIVFCPEHLTVDQLELLNIERLEPDHGARNNLILPFYNAQDLMEQLTKIPCDFAAWPEDEEE